MWWYVSFIASWKHSSTLIFIMIEFFFSKKRIYSGTQRCRKISNRCISVTGSNVGVFSGSKKNNHYENESSCLLTCCIWRQTWHLKWGMYWQKINVMICILRVTQEFWICAYCKDGFPPFGHLRDTQGVRHCKFGCVTSRSLPLRPECAYD